MKIEGVVVKELVVHEDIPDADENVAKSGFLMEVLRNDDGLLRKFGQSTFTVAYKDTIKAFHWHKKTGRLVVCGVRQGIYCSSRFKAKILHMWYH